MIQVTDVLTNKRWNLPDLGVLYMGQFPPGRYDVRNGSALGTLTVVSQGGGGGTVVAIVPRGATWNFATQENDRSYNNYCPDYAVWMHSGRFN